MSRDVQSSRAPSILALDLSLTAAGWCRDGETGVIRSKRRGMDRLAEILGCVEVLTGVDLVVIEGYSFNSQGRSVYQIGELGGVVRYSLFSRCLPFVEVPPAVLKKFTTGKGNSPKDAMLAAAIRRFGFEGSDNNEADSFLLWCLARHAYGDPVATVPVPQAAAAAKVEWPALAAIGLAVPA